MGVPLKFCFLFIFIMYSCSSLQDINDKTEYRLVNIDSTSYQYNKLLFLENNSEVYVVVIQKNKNCSFLEGETYRLKLKSNLPINYPNHKDLNSQYMYHNEVVYFIQKDATKWGFYKIENDKKYCK
ncbi:MULTISPECIES: hypothetical protein [Empedobacter]|uniref:Lipoprotein n=1 Tax=Empedobacter falsenii TaxID=343874 RepID=A0A7H9DWW2_9FLAO|nr:MULTISPECIES: hypothetical protein [Empedobacter]MDH2207369.1 hypothetical protein [Empedobacter sp. GD03644]QLL59688.1 hypothetical protein FH779_17055 [Empedobacter falsenii]